MAAAYVGTATRPGTADRDGSGLPCDLFPGRPLGSLPRLPGVVG